MVLKIVNPNAAGIDVSSTEMQVCVPLDRDAENNREAGGLLLTRRSRETSPNRVLSAQRNHGADIVPEFLYDR
ncbi:MAG: hypothetical protein LBT78_05025 [Tannerella sp.]|nr:hypothetical protein [Tannerella sp.]